MIRIKKRYIGLICLVLVIVAVSGCTSQGNGTGKYSDLKLFNTPTVTQHSDGSGNIFAGIMNEGSAVYRNVKAEVVGYDKNDAVVYNVTKTISRIDPGQVGDISIVLNDEQSIDHVDVIVVNATKEA